MYQISGYSITECTEVALCQTKPIIDSTHTNLETNRCTLSSIKICQIAMANEHALISFHLDWNSRLIGLIILSARRDCCIECKVILHAILYNHRQQTKD